MADECTPIKSSSRTISETVHAPVLSGNHLEMADSRCPASVHQNLLTSSSLKKTFEIDDGATDLRDIETLSILNTRLISVEWVMRTAVVMSIFVLLYIAAQ